MKIYLKRQKQNKIENDVGHCYIINANHSFQYAIASTTGLHL